MSLLDVTGYSSPPPPQNKASCFIQDYYKGYGSNTHERQYVLEYEEITCVPDMASRKG